MWLLINTGINVAPVSKGVFFRIDPSLNGKTKDIIKGADFTSALFSMWLGVSPMNEPFKKQLLGLR